MSGPLLIVSKTAVPAANLKELMAWLKVNHAQVTQGHNGSGGAQHLCGIELHASSVQPGNSCPIAALLPRCRTWSADASM